MTSAHPLPRFPNTLRAGQLRGSPSIFASVSVCGKTFTPIAKSRKAWRWSVLRSRFDNLALRVAAKFPGISFEDARAQARELLRMPAFRISSGWLMLAKRPLIRMNPFAAEFLAQGVLRRLGIRTAEARICGAEEARELLSGGFIVKFAEGESQILTWNPGAVPTGWSLVSRPVSGAASLDFV